MIRPPLTDERERKVIRFWRRGHLCDGSILVYLQWIRRFRAYCRKRQLIETDQLSLSGVDRFSRDYIGPRVRMLAASSCGVARRALHAWACALEGLGTPLPQWRAANAAP